MNILDQITRVEKKVYTFEEHQLSLDKIDTHALYVLEKLKQAGFSAYLVGGSVRDLLLKKKPKDFDISTSAEPEEIKKLFRNCILVGKRFRLAHIHFGKKILEVSTFRAGDVENEQLIVRDNVWGSPEEDALRRDFTINALFYDASNQTIIDFVNGYTDLQQKYLRTIGPAYARFKQDPVRMIRLLKFQARFGFNVDSEAHIALLECRHDIIKSSQARILEEILRMLESGSAKAFIQLMTDHGILDFLLPNLSAYLQKEAGVEVFSYLQEIDTSLQDPSKRFERPLLLACLVYPSLLHRINQLIIQRNQTPHLGEIQIETRNVLNEIFHGFFKLPRKLRISLISILIAQFRLTPLDLKLSRKKRIPYDPDFHLALKFLNLRCCLEPGLQKIHEEWMEAYELWKRRQARSAHRSHHRHHPGHYPPKPSP